MRNKHVLRTANHYPGLCLECGHWKPDCYAMRCSACRKKWGWEQHNKKAAPIEKCIVCHEPSKTLKYGRCFECRKAYVIGKQLEAIDK